MHRKLVLALSIVSCAPAAQEARESPEMPSTPPAVSARVLATLRSGAVTYASFARRTFYTWTSDAGVARIRKERRLLLETEDRGFFDEQIDTLAMGTGPSSELARILAHHPNLMSRRYAWARPFATRVPLTDRSYGDHLVAAVLKPNAVIARFDSREAVPFKLLDLEGQEVPLGRVIADPRLLAAVYHVAKHPHTGDDFREFVLCNESMIEEWSLGTDAIAAVIEDDRAAIAALARHGLPDVPASAKWAAASDAAGDLYAASLAFDTARHRPTRKNLESLAVLLTEVAREETPLVVTPAIPFTSTAPAPPKVPPLPPGFGIPKRVYKCS